MTNAEKVSFKNSLKQFCRQCIEQRITVTKQTMQQAQDAANSEEKSSAGDKYETGRAMGHLQKDMYTRQLTEQLKERTGLYKVDTSRIYHNADTGAFVEAGNTLFFIAAGLGKQAFQDKTIFFLSPVAPLAIQLRSKVAGDSFAFNNREYLITAVY